MGLFDTIFGGGDAGFDEAMRNVRQNRALLDSINLPQYENYNPEAYKYETIKEDPNLISAQNSALQKMSMLADQGFSDSDQAALLQARNQANQMAKSNRMASLSNAQGRGVAGSGLEFAMKEMGNQDATQRAQDAGLTSMIESARQKAMNQKSYMDAMNNQRSQNFQTNQANTGIVNQYNQMNTQGRNDAFQYNQGLKDKNFNNQMTRATGQMNNNNQMTEISLAKDAAERKKRAGVTGLIGAGIGGAYGGTQGAGVGYAVGSSL